MGRKRKEGWPHIKPGIRGPEKILCSCCGRDSRLGPYLLIKTITRRLNAFGWVPSPSVPGDWVCPRCAEELTPEEPEADNV